MAAPKIKIYLLPPGYTADGDNDVQQRVDDELLPCVPKEEPLESAVPLVGVVPKVLADCIKIVLPITADTLGSDGFLASADPHSVVMVDGAYGPAPYDNSGNPLPASGYEIISDTIGRLDHVRVIGTWPTPLHLHYYTIGSGATANWALPGDLPYTGPNDSLGRIVVVASGCSDPSYEGVPTLANGWLTGTNSGLLSLPFTCTSLRVTYWFKRMESQFFAGDYDNWVAEHLRMHPDVFVGETDYPGDDGSVNGTPVIAGTVPQFRDIGTYQVNYRDGYVRFPEQVDATQTPVKANYAHLVGVRNVTGQKLTVIGGTSNRGYSATAEAIFPASHGRPWVSRNDQWMPRNVYVNGVLAGQPVGVTAETLTVKTS